MRFEVRRTVGDVSPDLFAIVDTSNGQRLAWYTREFLAKVAAARMEQAHVADPFGASSGAWR